MFLHFAIKFSEKYLLTSMLNCNASPHTGFEHNLSPLQYARELNRTEMVISMQPDKLFARPKMPVTVSKTSSPPSKDPSPNLNKDPKVSSSSSSDDSSSSDSDDPNPNLNETAANNHAFFGKTKEEKKSKKILSSSSSEESSEDSSSDAAFLF